MRFEWDGRKAASNLRRRRVSFDEAVTVFSWQTTRSRPRAEYPTVTRRLSVERGGAVRLISARRATPRERTRHET